MSHFDDSPHEMHDDPLTPETADRLLDGEILSPEFAELAAMVGEVRHAVSSTPTPEVRGALAEFVGLHATEPAVSPTQPRRRSVIAEVMAFAGTMGGKVLIGGSLAAASVTGAQAAGLVDLPLLTDEPTTIVTTDQGPAELPLEAPAEVDKAEEDKAEKPPAVEEVAEDKVEEPKAEEAPKAEEPKEDEKPEVEEEKQEEKKTESTSNSDAIAVLQAQLANDKEANYALAADLIAPIKAEKKALVEALNTVLAPLEQARNEAKAPLYAELETTEDPARKTEIEAELGAIWDQWIIDRDAAAAAANPAIADLEAQIKAIETNRDVEISRLLTEYQAAVDALS